jgi:hypothetical protein
MTKLIRNLSFVAFLAAASFGPSTGLQAQSSCSYLIETYCTWGWIPPENGEYAVEFACSGGPGCSTMSWCCEEFCEPWEADYECMEQEGHIAGTCECW